MRGETRTTDERDTGKVRLRRTARAAAGLLATAALVAGCGGGGSTTGGVASLGSHTSASHSPTSGSAAASEGREASPGSQAVAYAACMHEHGIPDFPEPQVSEHGNSVSVKIAVPASLSANPEFKPAQEACRKLLPGGPGNQAPLTPAQQEQYLKAAACIRSHGLPSFPDPTFSGGGVHIEHTKLNEDSPAFKTAVHDCESLIPGGVHGGSGQVQEAAPPPGR
jgi:hypothetical protein